MSKRIVIAADWMNLEGRLTAFFSGDKTLQAMLDNELAGGDKVHAITAAELYGCEPKAAKSTPIILQGQPSTAYDGGKRLRHGWHYGMKERKMATTFWITLAEAERINKVMTALHPEIPLWWQRLGDEVFGVGRYRCGRCGYTALHEAGDCPQCSRRFPVVLKWDGWEREPQQVLYTPFGRRRIYLGRRSECMNALISQPPQSSGASMWYRTLARLHGVDIDGSRWPVPPNTRVWWERTYAQLRLWRKGYDTQILTGTYDSFLTETWEEMMDDVIQWKVWTMEQPWPQLGGLRVPAEVEVGENWGVFDPRKPRENPGGLRGIKIKPFTATWGRHG